MRALVFAIAIGITATSAWAQTLESVGDLAAKLAPGATDPATKLAQGSFSTEQLGAELDLLAQTSELSKIAETLQAVQKSAGAKYWSDDFDLVTALVALPPGSVNADAFRAVLGTACILQSLAKDGRKEAVSRIIQVAPDHGWMMRFEVTHRLKTLGEKAVAPLILARGDKRLRGFANTTLDAMGKKIPGDAVQTKSNDVLAAVLSAYGTTKDLDALGVVLSFVGSDRDEVRAAARAATIAYGDLALAKLSETLTNVQNAPPPSDWNAERIARALFDLLDRQRLAEIDALVDDGLARTEHDDIANAVKSFDKVLARMPFHARRTLMSPAYARLALSLEETDRAAARTAFQKSLDLDPNGTHAAEAHAELAVMDGEDLLARGIEDREPFERAITLDPGNVKARAALDRIDARGRDREERAHKWTWAAYAAGAFVILLVLFARLPRKKKRATSLP